MPTRDVQAPAAPVDAAWTAIGAAAQRMGSIDLSWLEPLPEDGAWTLAPDALRFVIALVQELQPRHVLEFGSGLSTTVLARAAADGAPQCRISSLESDPEAIEAAGDAPSRVALQLAPLVAREWAGKSLPTYLIDARALASAESVDLAIVDGPPTVLGGRESTLYQLLELARPGTVVVLDDADRPQERANVASWRDNLGEAVQLEFLPGFAKGLVVGVVRAPVARRDLWQRRLDLAAAELRDILANGDRILLADGWSLPAIDAKRYPGEAGDWSGAADEQAAAIRDLDRLAHEGFTLLAVAWPCAWWLEAYPDLLSSLPRVRQNDLLSLYRLSRG
jgi:predicted O-methyltransferase YrrM